MLKTLKELAIGTFFGAMCIGIMVMAYITQQADLWIIAALSVIALYRSWDSDWRGK